MWKTLCKIGHLVTEHLNKYVTTYVKECSLNKYHQIRYHICKLETMYSSDRSYTKHLVQGWKNVFIYLFVYLL